LPEAPTFGAVADDLVLSSAYVKTLDDWNKLISKLYQLSGNAVSPTAYKILCVPKALRGAGSTLRLFLFAGIPPTPP